MKSAEQLGRAGKTVAKGVVYNRFERATHRLDESSEGFKREAAKRIESVAEQLRELGQQFDHNEEAHSVARRLERTADYLLYRPSAELAGDAWNTAKKYRLLWWTGGLLAGVIAYRVISSQVSDRD